MRSRDWEQVIPFIDLILIMSIYVGKCMHEHANIKNRCALEMFGFSEVRCKIISISCRMTGFHTEFISWGEKTMRYIAACRATPTCRRSGGMLFLLASYPVSTASFFPTCKKSWQWRLGTRLLSVMFHRLIVVASGYNI